MRTVNVRIKYGGQVMSYDCGQLKCFLGDWVVVKNGDLTYLGQVVSAPLMAAEIRGQVLEAEGAEPSEAKPVKILRRSQKNESSQRRRMLRLATEADLARQAEHELREREAFDYCLSRVNAQGLAMKLVAVEVVFDGSKTIFFYTADGRVDFRLLVKELVSRFRTRIEMRQIGVRHEARMLGGLGGCGRHFCCAGFLANFAPVSVKMAKEQNVSLSPSKISGICGRLMCCLAFEHLGPPPENGAEADCPVEPELEENKN